MADARTRPEFGPEFDPPHKVQASPKLRRVKRRTVARVLHRARSVTEGLRCAQATARRLAWKCRQKWKDAPRCTVLREAQRRTAAME